jgi:hypothetical protein
MYYYRHLLVSHPTIQPKMCTALQNENDVSCLAIVMNKRQLTVPRGG